MVWKRLGACAAACVLLVAFATTQARAESRVALVIGNSDYQYTTTLKNPSNDAREITSALKTLGFAVVTGSNLTQSGFKSTLKEFAEKLRGAHTALFYYAGHGLQVQGENWLIPTDANLASELDLNLEAIPLRAILTSLEQSAQVRIVFLDACRDNPMAVQLAQGMGTRSTSVGRGLARVETGIGTLIAYSTQPGAIARDGEGNNSPFTSALLELIPTPGLEIRQLLTRVRVEVVKATNQTQVPWDHSSLMGDFFFAPGDASAAVAAAVPGPTAAMGLKPYREPGNRFEISFPAGWTIEELKNLTQAIHPGQKYQRANCRVQWTTHIETEGMSQDEVNELINPPDEKYWRENPLGRYINVKFEDHGVGRLREFVTYFAIASGNLTQDNGDVIDVKAWIVGISTPGWLNLITCESMVHHFDQLRPIFAKTIDSFQPR
jgi:hypothetical protein